MRGSASRGSSSLLRWSPWLPHTSSGEIYLATISTRRVPMAALSECECLPLLLLFVCLLLYLLNLWSGCLRFCCSVQFVNGVCVRLLLVAFMSWVSAGLLTIVANGSVNFFPLCLKLFAIVTSSTGIFHFDYHRWFKVKLFYFIFWKFSS